MSKAALKAAAKEAAEEARRQLEKRLTIGRRLEVGWLEKGDRNDDERSWYEGTIVDAEEHKTGRREGDDDASNPIQGLGGLQDPVLALSLERRLPVALHR